VKVKYPDSLTGWKATARAACRETTWHADATTRTSNRSSSAPSTALFCCGRQGDDFSGGEQQHGPADEVKVDWTKGCSQSPHYCEWDTVNVSHPCRCNGEAGGLARNG
jgi:hypothetical protein